MAQFKYGAELGAPGDKYNKSPYGEGSRRLLKDKTQLPTLQGTYYYDWTRFSRKKSCFFWVDRNPTLASASYLATLLWRKDDEDSFSPKLHVCTGIKDNNNSPHGKFHRFLFPFSSKFSDLNFTSYVLYIYLYYVTCHTQRAWVTYGEPLKWWAENVSKMKGDGQLLAKVSWIG